MRGKSSKSMVEKRNISMVLGSMVLAIVCSSPVFAYSVQGIQILKISPQDERAVIKTADGKTKIIMPGEIINSGQQSVASFQQKQDSKKHIFTVIEIAEGRVVLEERQGNDKETVIIRLKDGKQTVERIRKTPK
jgi:hypothetical protein